MAIPTIHGNTSLLALVRGVGFAFQPTGENLPRVDATASASNDTLTFASASPSLANGARVRVLPFAGQTLPVPLNEQSTYFLRDFTATTCKLAATSGGAAINLTSNGGYFRLVRADTWSADGLPDGLEIDPATGLLSGAAALPGVYNVTLRARNSDGQSAEHLIVIGVEPNRYLQDASVEIDINLRDSRVRLAGPPVVNGATSSISAEPEPVLHVKSGDRIVLSIGFMKDETLRPDSLRLIQQLREAVGARRDISVDILNYRKDGTPFRNGVLVAPLFDDEGDVAWFLGSQVELGEDANLGLDARRFKAKALVDSLPMRQRQVLQLMAQGLLNKQIAWQLKISEKTVKMHRALLLQRLDVATSAEAIRIAVEAGN